MPLGDALEHARGRARFVGDADDDYVLLLHNAEARLLKAVVRGAQVLRQRFVRSGTWHLTASGETSWFGFAEAIIDGAQARGLLARRPHITPIATADYPTPAARPAYSVLDTTALQRDFDLRLPSWQDGLGSVLGDIARMR